MRKYKWDLNEIRNNITTLTKLYDVIDDDYSKKAIKSIIEMYKGMISIYSKKSFKAFDDTYQGYSVEVLLDDTISFYQENNIPLLDIILNSYNAVKDNYIESEADNIKIISDNDYLIKICSDFFQKMTPKYLYDNYINAMKNKSFLSINYLKEDNLYAGMTYFDAILNKKYVNIVRSNTLLDLIFLPHEMFHYLLSGKVDISISDFKSYYLTEVEGSFANILFGEYFNTYAKENNSYFKDYHHFVFQCEIEEIVIRNSLLDATRDNKKIRLNKLNKQLNYYEMLEFDKKEELEEYLAIPQDVNINYSLSYLVAVDLYYIYKKDPEFAFYLLKNIKYFKHEDDIISLLRRNHITFMDDDYSNLKKYLKK